MRIMVTGGGGYIGSVLVRMLLEKGFDVTVVDRLFFGKIPLEEIEDQIRIIKDDIRWVNPLILNGIDVVIDMAALSNDPSGELDKTKTLDINYLGRSRIARLSKEYGVKKYIMASSCSVYGFQDGILYENSNLNPLTTYAKANVLLENDVLSLADDKNFSVTVLRQATVYGLSPRMRFDLAINGMVLGFFKNGKIPICRDGKQWRPFVHIKDTCKAFLSVIEADIESVNNQIFNVGSNEQNYQIFSLAKLIANALDIPFNYEWYGTKDTRSYRVNFDKIKNILKFKPDYTPKEGAKEIFEALKNGAIKPDDIKTKTVEWYKYLLEIDSIVKEVSIRNIIL
ncbi:MAG: SDR family oxidoreductase [Candidatus Aenigmatarchaeota archaeon]